MVSITDAQANLPEIVDNLKAGEEVILTRGQEAVAKLVPFPTDTRQPVFGSCHGKLVILSEDDEHLDDFSEYMA